MMSYSRYSIRVRIAIIAVVALTLVLAAAPLAQAHAASLPNCNVSGATPCFEKVWVDGAQVKMTFVDLNPQPHSPSDINFYVLAPQTGHPPGGPVPFSKTVNGHRLISADRIESGVNSGLLTLIDTGAVFTASLPGD